MPVSSGWKKSPSISESSKPIVLVRRVARLRAATRGT
jgi:hypothetical protein